ncbi:MAG: DEAD/DEAH box helicase [Acidimicrobiia bacterium]|nr:DEAD/DEAH box helicase [Acidimicrobiia bacterium]
MSEPINIDELADDQLDDLYDPGALARGQTYAEEGRVTIVSSDARSITAVCLGSGRATYLVRIRWTRSHGVLNLDDDCTCPLGGACKHCVATIVTVRDQSQRPQGRDGAATAAAPAAAASVGGSALVDWRQALADLTHDEHHVEHTGLALQIVVHRPERSRFASAASTPRLTIRPLRRGRSGRWVKTGASWRDITSPYNRDMADVDRSHRAALRALTTSCSGDLYYATSQAVSLTSFGPDLWYQLERALEAGVVLVGGGDHRTVALSPVPATAHVDLTADADGSVLVAAGFVVDGQPLAVPPDGGGLIGSPPHALWVTRGDELFLVPFAAPLHPSVARLATDGGVVVPEGDVDELLDIYQPALARHATVASSDASVPLTTTLFDSLVLTVERTDHMAATAVWSARYRRGERTMSHPLHQRCGTGRDPAAEAAALDELKLPLDVLAELVDTTGSPQDLALTGPLAATLLVRVVPWLEAQGQVDVELVGEFPALRQAVEDPIISLTVTDSDHPRDGNDWFDLDVNVSVDGETVDFVALFTALNRDEEVLILPSGTWLYLDDRPELEQLRDLIEEARSLADPAGTGVARLNPFQAGWWDELAALGVVTEQSERWTASVARMSELAAPEPVEPPAALQAELRPYQQEGLDWLAFLHRHGLGGILADDMGLGKTVQTLALCLHVLEQRPDARFLVVAPTSVVQNWAREAARFAPGVNVCTISQTEARRRTTLAEEIADATIVVTSYALFRLEFDDYDRHDWELVLLDEAQFVKNHQGKTHQCVRRLNAASKIALTGTPLENTLMDLWSLLSITAPGLYADPQRFDETYRKPIESGNAPELLATLRRRIAPLLRRRTKSEVLTDLPPKVEQTVEVQLNARHARIYATQLQRQRQKVLGLVGDVRRNRFEILKSLTILRQLALDPGLVDDAHDDVGSAKLDRLLDDLTQVVAEGHRALIFSQFTRYLARLRTRLDAAGIDHSYLDGRTRNRDEAIARFTDGDVPVFVISLKAGGFGLNLTEADYCFVLDPWWNPATETQAVDRAHRIGQVNPVMVYRYVSVGTIEEKVVELKARKSDLFDSVMSSEGTLSKALTEDDIRGLLDHG